MAFFDSDSHDLESFRWCLSSVGTLRAFVFFFSWWGGKIPVSYPLTISCYERGNVLESHCFSSFEFLGGHCEFLAPIKKKKSIWATFREDRWPWFRGPTWLLSALGGLLSMPFKPKQGWPVWVCGPEGVPSHRLGWKAWDGGVCLADCCWLWKACGVRWAWSGLETHKGQNVGQQGGHGGGSRRAVSILGVSSPRLAGTAVPAWRAPDGAPSSACVWRGCASGLTVPFSPAAPLFVSPHPCPVPYPTCPQHPCKVGMGTTGPSLGLYPRLPRSAL